MSDIRMADVEALMAVARDGYANESGEACVIVVSFVGDQEMVPPETPGSIGAR